MNLSHIRCSFRHWTLLLLVLAGSVSRADEVEKVESVPSSDVAVNQTELAPGSGVQARYRGEGDYRCVTQTFVWTTDGALSGVGLRVADDSNLRFAHPQRFFLDIQKLNSAEARVVRETLISVPFVLTTEKVELGKYLYIRFDSPLPLRKDGAYGFNVRPQQSADNRLILAWSGTGTGKSYTGGVASQNGTREEIAPGERYGNPSSARDFDLVFYLTSAADTH